MRQIEDYTFEGSELHVLTFDDSTHESVPCDKHIVPFEKIKEAYEALGYGYESEGFNKTNTDIESHLMCKETDQMEFIIDQMNYCMRSDDVQDIIKKAIELN